MTITLEKIKEVNEKVLLNDAVATDLWIYLITGHAEMLEGYTLKPEYIDELEKFLAQQKETDSNKGGILFLNAIVNICRKGYTHTQTLNLLTEAVDKYEHIGAATLLGAIYLTGGRSEQNKIIEKRFPKKLSLSENMLRLIDQKDKKEALNYLDIAYKKAHSIEFYYKEEPLYTAHLFFESLSLQNTAIEKSKKVNGEKVHLINEFRKETEWKRQFGDDLHSSYGFCDRALGGYSEHFHCSGYTLADPLISPIIRHQRRSSNIYWEDNCKDWALQYNTEIGRFGYGEKFMQEDTRALLEKNDIVILDRHAKELSSFENKKRPPSIEDLTTALKSYRQIHYQSNGLFTNYEESSLKGMKEVSQKLHKLYKVDPILDYYLLLAQYQSTTFFLTKMWYESQLKQLAETALKEGRFVELLKEMVTDKRASQQDKYHLLGLWEKQLDKVSTQKAPIESYLTFLVTLDSLLLTAPENEFDKIAKLYALVPLHEKGLEAYITSQIQDEKISLKQNILLLTAWERQLHHSLKTKSPESYISFFQAIITLVLSEKETELSTIISLYSLIPYEAKDIQQYLELQIVDEEVDFEQKWLPLIAFGKQLNSKNIFSSERYNLFFQLINKLLLSAQIEEYEQVIELYKLIPLNENSLEAYLKAQVSLADYFYTVHYDGAGMDEIKRPKEAYLAAKPYYDNIRQAYITFPNLFSNNASLRHVLKVSEVKRKQRMQDEIKLEKEDIRKLPEIPEFTFARKSAETKQTDEKVKDKSSETQAQVEPKSAFSEVSIKSEFFLKSHLRKMSFLSFFKSENTAAQPDAEEKVSDTKKMQPGRF